jgi:hypothetical protein
MGGAAARWRVTTCVTRCVTRSARQRYANGRRWRAADRAGCILGSTVRGGIASSRPMRRAAWRDSNGAGGGTVDALRNGAERGRGQHGGP